MASKGCKPGVRALPPASRDAPCGVCHKWAAHASGVGPLQHELLGREKYSLCELLGGVKQEVE